MTKKKRGFTNDGWVRVQRTVLRRVVGDRLQALLRGDFYVRNHLGEEDYDPILKEVAALHVPPTPAAPVEGSANGHASNGGGRGRGDARLPQSQSPLDASHPHKFTQELETFIQLIAASIMIDASMRGENAGESDTRFIKKKKKLLAKTLQGPKLGDFRKEVLRFDMVRRGEDFEEEEIVESEESRSSDSDSESESDVNSEDEAEAAFEARRKHKKRPPPRKPSAKRERPPPQVPIRIPSPPKPENSGGESSSASEDDEEHDSTVSDTATSNTSLSQDGFSTSATSSKHQRKKDKKRLKKERKKEKKRLKKEKKRREKEERRQRRKRKLDKEKTKKHAAKRRKKAHGHNEEVSFADNELSDGANGYGDGDAADEPADPPSDRRPSGGAEGEALVYEIATRADFEQYKEDLLSRVPKSVKSRFREGGFSRWGKDWLPVLELGPFDVEPGPVREMWLEMFDNTQDNGRDMTRLVFWYGVKFEDRGQAYSFVPKNKLIKFEEGEHKGFCKMPKKIQQKIEDGRRLTRTEEQIKRGLREIEGDMRLDKADRAAWMMQFKEDYELIEEEAATEMAESQLKPASVEEKEDIEQPAAASIPKKRKPGRPKKEESAVVAATDKPIKRKPGRPKKVVDASPPPEEDDNVKVKKKGPGRPKKSDKEKAEKAAAKAAKAALKEAEMAAAMEAEKAAAKEAEEAAAEEAENAAAKKAEKAAARKTEKAAARKLEQAASKKAKKSSSKKWLLLDDPESDVETEEDDNDRDYDFDVDSGDDGDMDVDGDDDNSDEGESHKHKAEDSLDKKPIKKPKIEMSEEEKALERRAKAAEYREKKAREKAEAQGLEYVKGRVGRKSKQTMLEEEQQKFTKCEDVFLPMMDRLTEARETSNAKGALSWINSIMDRVELLTPPFLREYPLGMLMKTVRKSFEGVHPEVKEQSKRLTSEMKRVYTEKEKKVPDGFEPVKNKKSSPEHELQEYDKQESYCPTPNTVPFEEVPIKSEKNATKAENIAAKAERAEIPGEQSMPKRNASEMSLAESVPRKMPAVSSSECLPDRERPEPQPPAPKQKKTFSIKGMFKKPKPAPKPKITAPMSSTVVSSHPSPKPKPLPSWVTGPAVKMDSFHEQHAKERTFGLEFLVDAASLLPPSSSKRFDPVSVSQSFELAIFAETKLRGRDWQQYWEKVHDVVAMLSPGKGKRNAILQGIVSGDYQEPSELVKLSRREIQSLNRLRS